MKLSEREELWGLSLTDIKDENKKYKLKLSVSIVIDILSVAIITKLMYNYNVSFETYLFGVLGISFIIYFIFTYLANPTKHRVYSFYFKYKGCELIEESFDMDAERLYSLAYCIGFRKLKPNKDMDYYKQAIINYCYDDYYNSAKFYKYLSRYSKVEDGLKVLVIKRGSKSFFIDFVESEEVADGSN